MSNQSATVAAPSNLSDGTSASERQSRTGEMLNSNVHGKYYDQAFRGKLFHCDFGVSATGIAISTIGTSPGVALFNPAGSGVNLAIISVRLGFVSGTLILGSVMGDVALVQGASAVAIAGGMAPRMTPFLNTAAVRSRFEAKGRSRPLLGTLPIALIRHAQPGLIGAANLVLPRISVLETAR